MTVVLLGVAIVWLSIILFNNSPVTVEDKLMSDYKDNKYVLAKIVSYLNTQDQSQSIDSTNYDKSNESLNILFKNMEYRSINLGGSGVVYFIKQSSFGFTQGLVYSADGNPPSSPYLTEAIPLDGGWFIFKSK